MYRVIKEMNAEEKMVEKVYGVLTDYDLSSWTADLATDYTRTSQQRTGTPPYMAHELLKGTSGTHLYRHDVESFFYIMLMMCARHTIGSSGEGKEQRVIMREGRGLPYQDWFNQHNYEALGRFKKALFSDMEHIELSQAFEDFRGWLLKLQWRFSEGFELKTAFARQQQEQEWDGIPVVGAAPFNDETLGGCIDYSTVIKPVHHLKGKLEGLIIRYNPTSSPLPTPTGTV